MKRWKTNSNDTFIMHKMKEVLKVQSFKFKVAVWKDVEGHKTHWCDQTSHDNMF